MRIHRSIVPATIMPPLVVNRCCSGAGTWERTLVTMRKKFLGGVAPWIAIACRMYA
jgi:hypothetical protein